VPNFYDSDKATIVIRYLIAQFDDDFQNVAPLWSHDETNVEWE